MTRVGSEVIRPILRSLDDMPVHVRQLAEMFRKHGDVRKQDIDEIARVDRSLDDLGDGWKTDKWDPLEVERWGKGNRPDPAEYLDGDYIKNHLKQFEGGATHIYRKSTLDEYGPGNFGTTYVFPTDRLDDLVRETGGDPVEIARQLGLPANFFTNGDVVLRDFGPDELDGLRMPSGNEAGTDAERWIPGGYLPSGIPEAVIDIPETATGWRNGEYLPSFWPGNPRTLDLNG